MRIFMTGATGLIGQRLVVDRLARGDEVLVLTRNPAKASFAISKEMEDRLEILTGHPRHHGPWQAKVDGCDALVNLAGAGIADRRWSRSYKLKMVESRLDSTRNVVDAIKMATHKPKVLVNASAIGYYGETKTEPIDEQASSADDFLAQLCVKWETEATIAQNDQTRVVRMRIGLVLDPKGGALKEMVKPFRFFMGGPMGTGRQFMSWIHWRDLVGLFDLALTNDLATGPINAVSPDPITNREFSKTLGLAIHRPSWLPAPTFGLSIVLGEFAKYITMSQRIVPEKARELGYVFKQPDLKDALADLFFAESS